MPNGKTIEERVPVLSMTDEEWTAHIQAVHNYYLQLEFDRRGDLFPKEKDMLETVRSWEREGWVKPYTPKRTISPHRRY